MKEIEGRNMETGAGAIEDGRRPTGVAPPYGVLTGGLAPGQRWSIARKREVVLRPLRGKSLDGLLRGLGEKSTGWRSGATRDFQVSMPGSKNGRATRSRRGWMRL
jgi:hypothetical protein